MRNEIHRQNGFTLIELMITVAVVAILAAVAYPSYITYIQRGYRSEGIAMLSDAVARVERYFAQNNTYVGATPTAVGFASVTSQSNKYTLSFPTIGATTYILQVAPIGTQANDGCGTLTINQAGAKTPDPSTSPNCWK